MHRCESLQSRHTFMNVNTEGLQQGANNWLDSRTGRAHQTAGKQLEELTLFWTDATQTSSWGRLAVRCTGGVLVFTDDVAVDRSSRMNCEVCRVVLSAQI